MKILALTLLTLLPALLLAGLARSVYDKKNILHPVNPCYSVVGAQAWYRIDVEPRSAIPDSDITWEPDNPELLQPGEIKGRLVAVEPTAVGENGLTVKIKGYNGPDPYIHADSVTQTVTKVYAWIVGDGDGYYARTPASVSNLIIGANQIYRQVGMKFVLESISYTNNRNLLVLNNDSMFYEKVANICNIGSTTGGIKVYCINEILKGKIPAMDVCQTYAETNHFGIIISKGIKTAALAHEVGHTCELPDIYFKHYATPLTVTGPISRNRIPDDWGTKSNVGYYPSEMEQADFIKRLVMCGYSRETAAGISYGDVDGLHFKRSIGGVFWHTNSVPIGFRSNANRYPRHQ